MKIRRNWFIAFAFLTVLPAFSNPAFGQSAPANASEERSAMIQEQNWLRSLRKFEQESRHLYYLQSNAMLSAYGGWSEGDFTYGDHILLVKEAGEIIAESVSRLKRQLNNGKWGDADDTTRLSEAVAQMQMAIDASIVISDLLRAGDLATANSVYREKSVPLFKAIWASNYTLVSNAERRFPRR